MLTKTKKPSIPWKRAKAIPLPIPKTGTKFKQYPDMPARPCEVTASFQYVPLGQAWYWRFELDTPLMHHGDPQANDRRPAVSSDKAIEAALAKILECLREEVELRRKHKQTEIAGACAQAVFHVQEFVKYFRETGKFRHQPIVAVQHSKPTTAIAIREAVAVVAPKASAAERKKALRDYHNARQTLQRGWQDLGETAIRVQDTGAWADEGKASFEEWIVAERGHSVVRQAMLAIRQRTRFLPIAKRYDLPIDPDVEDHFRALPAKINGEPITDTDLVAIAEQTKKLMKHDVPLTGKLIREAVKLTQMDGDELAAYKREQRQRKTVVRSEPTAGMFARGPAPIAVGHLTEDREEILLPECASIEPTFSDKELRRKVTYFNETPSNLAAIASEADWREILSEPPTADGSSPAYWNGQPNPYASQLRGIAAIVQRLAARHLGQANWESEFRRQLASLLRSLAGNIEHEQLAPKAARRAK